jgi:DNA-binding CsgD family transcriptional regulator
MRAEAIDSELARISVLQLFELSPFGLLWLDSTGRVALANGGARRILSLADGIRIRSGRLSFTRSGLTRELGTFLARANHFGESFTGRFVQRVPRPSAAPAYLMIAMPWVGRARAGALLILEDFVVPPPLGGELCRFVYGLTKAETRIATRLIKGLSTSEIGTDLGLSTLTIRTYMKRLFKKAGVRSQAQLMAALCRLAFLPIGRSPVN